MVKQRTLTPSFLVRVQVPQLEKKRGYDKCHGLSFCFLDAYFDAYNFCLKKF
jgi:hypothetical protein